MTGTAAEQRNQGWDFHMTVASFTQALRADGFLILPDAVSFETIEQARDELERCFEHAPFCEGSFYGRTTKRFGRLLNRLSDAAAFALHPTVLAIAKQVLCAEQVQLNLTQAIEIHPGAPVQVPHRDHDMWSCSKSLGVTFMVNVMWPLDAFTAENGATRIWPGSHERWSTEPPDEAAAIHAVATPGAAIFFLGQTLHSGGANRSVRARRGMIFSYCQEWLLPDENPWLAYPPAVASTFSAELAALAGYRQRNAGLNNFEGRDPGLLLAGEVPPFLQFADDLNAGQRAMIDDYYLKIAGAAA